MIWFLRHAEAVDGIPDSERELTAKGRGQAEYAGRALAKLDVRFDACFTSPKERALETARLACRHLGVEPTIEESLAQGEFDAAALTAGLDNTLLVGHEPDFSAAVQDLTGARIEFKKSGVAVVDGRLLLRLLRPADLRAMADGG
ncbi:MAG: histidine phosphatase family protein [Thermoleophilaceae bacterium]|nr:histidine phosphatase family protein [Thermoleophilaceae bacterium]